MAWRGGEVGWWCFWVTRYCVFKHYFALETCKVHFFSQHLLMHKMCLTLERESSARKNKKHCMVFALEGAGKASKPEAIKDGNQQAKATDANEVT